MAKLTEKLNEALRTLGEQYNPKTPNIVLYAKLAQRNYHWDGKHWTRHGFSELGYPCQIRIQGASSSDCQILADGIALCLHAGGYRVTVNPPREDRSTTGWRQYLEVE